jgi:cytochrome P450
MRGLHEVRQEVDLRIGSTFAPDAGNISKLVSASAAAVLHTGCPSRPTANGHADIQIGPVPTQHTPAGTSLYFSAQLGSISSAWSCYALLGCVQVYIEACFREALRLHPPVGTVNRDVALDTTLKGEHLGV